MGEKEQAPDKQQQTPAEVPPPVPPPVDPPQPPPNPDPERYENPKKMSKSEKIMVWATCVIAAGTLVSAGAICFQWREMVNGGVDTAAIKIAAQKQADAAQQFADTAEDINGSIGDAVKKLDAQAKGTQRSANAAKSAAVTADKVLHVSERAYVVAGQPTIDIETKYITLPIENSGRIPSGKVRAIIHEVTIDGVNPAAVLSVKYPVTEAHWKHQEMESVPVTTNQTMSFTIFVPAINVKYLNDGREQIFIVGVITYSDGFPDDTEQRWPFCYGSALLSQSKHLIWGVCDSNLYLPQAIEQDHYPNNEFQAN
jgi:hypothetical protein